MIHAVSSLPAFRIIALFWSEYRLTSLSPFVKVNEEFSVPDNRSDNVVQSGNGKQGATTVGRS